MNVEDQRFQLRLEAKVVVRAAETPLAAELVEGDSANRACLLVQLLQVLGGLADRHLLGHLLSHVLGHGRSHSFAGRWFLSASRQILPCMIFAQVEFLGRAVRQFGDMACGRFIALLALHGRNSERWREMGGLGDAPIFPKEILNKIGGENRHRLQDSITTPKGVKVSRVNRIRRLGGR